ncbi:MAG: hypothetical protein GOV01_01895 [Candidatus Altiarchaeota archaeon]|nr:hypothetical protein [Candidatus Altiarchaeota archaeon]
MDARLSQKIETKVEVQIRMFITDLKKEAPHKARDAEGHWNDYKPEILKCQSKNEVAQLILSFFERELRGVANEIDAKTFHRLKYDTVGKLQNILFTLRIHKNAMKDYTKHLHSIKGKDLGRGIRMADEKPWETPDEVDGNPEVRKPITTKELRKRHGKPANFKAPTFELIAAGGFAIASLLLFLIKLFG